MRTAVVKVKILTKTQLSGRISPTNRSNGATFFCKPNFCNAKFLSFGPFVQSFWARLVSRLEQPADVSVSEKNSEGLLKDVKRVRDVLINSRRPTRVIGNGDILPETLAKEFCSYYRSLSSKAEKLKMFTFLAKEFGLNYGDIRIIAKDITRAKERGVTTVLKLEEKLQQSAQPPYITLLSYVGRLEGGVKFIVDLREDLLAMLSNVDLHEGGRDELNDINHHIRSLLSMWFSVGFLNMERITWRSPCDITEKVANYEAVHVIRNWMDIKKRIGPYRRCFVFMHPSMPREPVCVLHTALREDVPESIQEILAEDIPSEEMDIEKKDTAVFYSVSSTQKGLAEIDLGNFIIKEAVNQLKHDFPNIQHFVTLSPIPGFRKWLDYKLMESSESAVIHNIMENKMLNCEERKALQDSLKKPYNISLKELLRTSAWLKDLKFCEILRKPLMEVCANYLYNEKKRRFAYDPVANFHLHNGASLWRLNWKGDVSKKGLQSSLGMMVNYRYTLGNCDRNTRQYLLKGDIAVSEEFMKLLSNQW